MLESPPGPPAEAAPPAAVARFPVVGIGSSAGGLAPLEALLRRVGPRRMSYVIVQHLAPGHESLLPEILRRATELPVVSIQDGMPVQPGTVYVMPPDADLTIGGGAFQILPPSARVPRHSIDVFLRSLSAELGPAAIGVVLSGAGSDGTLGLRAIKEEGGITFVQEPASASQPSMPQAALDAGVVDFALSAEELGDELMRLGVHPFVARPRPARLFDDQPLGAILELLRRALGVDFSAYKPTTIERRIARRMALSKVETIEEYQRHLERPGELNLLYSDLLIGVTGFFRDGAPFEALKRTVFAQLSESRNGERPIRIWVPGCASGEEAYSIAICLLEVLGDRAPSQKIQIFATDVDEEALARGRLGSYPQSIELDVSPERLGRFFVPAEGGYTVSRLVRDLVLFARHDVGKDPPFSRLDLISCRNVLIYMQLPLQRKVLRVFHYALNPDAHLLLGLSESVGDAADLFSLVDQPTKLYSKKHGSSAGVYDFTFGARRPREDEGLTGLAPRQTEHRHAVTVQQIADRQALERYAPPAVLVSDKLEVLQFRGRTGPYLDPAPGAATLQLLKLSRPELLPELREAIRRAREADVPAQSAPIRPATGEGYLTIDVAPVHDPGAGRTCLLVSFHEHGPGHEEPSPGPAAGRPAVADQARLQLMERELLTTKEFLQTTVQELEAANEELQSSNEEMQSSNEELQSSNEELETSKEELQSTNEELTTVNEELESRMTQLAVADDDLRNVLASSSSPFVLVGLDLRIRRFSAAAERLLNLLPADLGRPVDFLASSLRAPVAEIVAAAIERLAPREQRVLCTDGIWYTLRVAPYLTADHSIRGAVLELLRTPAPRRPEEPLAVHELVGKVLSTLPHSLLLLDDQLRAVWANRRFFDQFHVGAEILGLPFDEVWAGRAQNPELFSLLEATVAGGAPFRDQLVRGPFGGPDAGPLRFSAHRIPAEGDRQALTLLVVELQEAPRG